MLVKRETKAYKEPSKQPQTLVETPPSSSKSGSQSVTSDDIDDIWVTDDELTKLTVADGQVNIFGRINQCFGT